MQRVSIGTAAILLAAGSSLAVGVAARPKPPAADPMPAYLKPVPMGVDVPATTQPIIIDVPINGTIYPPDLIAPQFAWRDNNPAAVVWRIEILFGEKARPIQVWSAGEKMQIGPIDESLTGYVPPTLTPEQAADHTWRPDPKTWEEIKKHSVSKAARVVITGYANQQAGEPISHAEATISTSKEPVGAPIFYRDVPLLPRSPEESQREIIKPLPTSALPSIKWHLRYVSEPQSKVMMQGLTTCANCHSISHDGRTMGIDVDGPQNDKGLYALIPLKKITSISNEYVLQWSSFSDERAEKRFGFMSQVSPDGKYVITSIDPPHAHMARVMDRIYNGQFYNNYGFGQVFYPTRGVLAWYSKETGKLLPLPGADDPNYVQASAFWSPEGKYLIYSRAVARDPYPAGSKRSTYANDPNETQIQYDLYKIPFNNGKGGTPERVIGASENGMSNNFPKVSPDGKWIVFVECKNGLLMRPDSKLYIVPFEGGEARPLESNLPVMNSWHTFNPNGHWLAFSSKSPSLYTHLYLTHIDDQGHASPPIVVENATASNRAVNIPEFVNLGPEGMDHIETPAIDFYRDFDKAQQLQDEHKYADAIPAWKIATAENPDDARAYNNMGIALAAIGKTSDAIAAYEKSLSMNNDSAQTHNNLGSALAEAGRLDEAMTHIQKAIALDPDNGAAHINLGHLLEVTGHREQAIEQLKTGMQIAPKNADGHNIYGVILAREGKMDEAIAELEQAIALSPDSAECHYNLGRAYAASSRFTDALPQFEAAAKLSGNREPAILQMLAAMYSETGNYTRAVAVAQQAVGLAEQQQNGELATALRANLARYQHQAENASPAGRAQN